MHLNDILMHLNDFKQSFKCILTAVILNPGLIGPKNIQKNEKIFQYIF